MNPLIIMIGRWWKTLSSQLINWLHYFTQCYFVLVVCWFLNHSWLLGNTMYCCKDCCLLGNRRRPVKQLIGVSVHGRQRAASPGDLDHCLSTTGLEPWAAHGFCSAPRPRAFPKFFITEWAVTTFMGRLLWHGAATLFSDISELSTNSYDSDTVEDCSTVWSNYRIK